MDVLRIESPNEAWDRFVWSSPGGTIFHTLRFQTYHPASRFEFVNLEVADDGKPVCVVPGGAVRVDSRTVFRSPVGASFAGFLFGESCGLRTKCDAVQHVTSALRDYGFSGVDIVLPPACYSPSGQEEIRFLLTSAGYVLTLREASYVTRLAETRGNATHRVLARNLRKAERAGVVVRPAERPGPFYEVLEKNLNVKKVKPTHSLEELEKLIELFPERIKIFEGVLEESVVGGCMVMLCNGRVALAFYICDDPDARQYRITEVVLQRAIEWLEGEGYVYLDLGTISRSGEPDWGLIRFKSKFGPRLYSRECYSLRFGEA
jgi:hypothetical protein